MVKSNRKTQHFASFVLPTKGCKIALRVIDCKKAPDSRSGSSWIYGEVASVKYKARCVIIESRFTKDEAKMKIGVRKDILKFSLFGRAPPKVWHVLTKEEEKKFTPLPEGEGVKEVKMKAVLAEPEAVMDEDREEDEDGEEGERDEGMKVQDDEDGSTKDMDEIPSMGKKEKKRKEKKKEPKEKDSDDGKDKKQEEQPKEEDPTHVCCVCSEDFKQSEMEESDTLGMWTCRNCC